MASITLRDVPAPTRDFDSPQRLFDTPCNVFVAGFIGSPAMNLVWADLVRDDGLALHFGGHQLPLAATVVEHRPGLAAHVGERSVWTATLDPDAPVRAGEPATLTVDMRRCQLFDPDTGQAIA